MSIFLTNEEAFFTNSTPPNPIMIPNNAQAADAYEKSKKAAETSLNLEMRKSLSIIALSIAAPVLGVYTIAETTHDPAIITLCSLMGFGAGSLIDKTQAKFRSQFEKAEKDFPDLFEKAKRPTAIAKVPPLREGAVAIQ